MHLESIELFTMSKDNALQYQEYEWVSPFKNEDWML